LSRLYLLAVLWGSGFLFVKLALRGLSPVQIVLGQLTFGAVVLLLTLVVRRQPLPHGGRQWAYLAGMAVLANIAPYLLFSWSEQRISSGLAGALSATTPLCTLVLALAFGVGRLIGLCQVGARGGPVRRSHRGAGRLHSGQAPAQQASSTCSSPSSCHKVRPTPPVLGVAAAPGSRSHARSRPA
jgi:hypothetical protein